MTPTHSSLERQFVLLRRQNRMLLAAMTGLVLLTALGAARRPEVSRASAFQLVDPSGEVRAELAFKEGAVGLFLRDENGRERLRVFHHSDGTGVYVKDEKGTTRVGVAQFSHGGGGVALHGPDSKGAAALYLKREGSLRFFDLEGRVTNEVLATAPEKE